MGDWVLDSLVGFLQSPRWTHPLNNFIDEKCLVFDPGEENKFSYTDIHKKYSSLVESLLEQFMEDINMTPKQFIQAWEKCGENCSFEKDLTQQIVAADDFLCFKAMMVQRNMDLEKEAWKLVEHQRKNTNFHEPPPSYTAIMYTDDESALQQALELSRKEYDCQRLAEEEELRRLIAMAEVQWTTAERTKLPAGVPTAPIPAGVPTTPAPTDISTTPAPACVPITVAPEPAGVLVAPEPVGVPVAPEPADIPATPALAGVPITSAAPVGVPITSAAPVGVPATPAPADGPTMSASNDTPNMLVFDDRPNDMFAYSDTSSVHSDGGDRTNTSLMDHNMRPSNTTLTQEDHTSQSQRDNLTSSLLASHPDQRDNLTSSLLASHPDHYDLTVATRAAAGGSLGVNVCTSDLSKTRAAAGSSLGVNVRTSDLSGAEAATGGSSGVNVRTSDLSGTEAAAQWLESARQELSSSPDHSLPHMGPLEPLKSDMKRQRNSLLQLNKEKRDRELQAYMSNPPPTAAARKEPPSHSFFSWFRRGKGEDQRLGKTGVLCTAIAGKLKNSLN